MQIWFPDPSPIKSAEILFNKSPQRARKCIVEFMQCVAYLCELHDLPLPKKIDGTPYKAKLASRFPNPLLEWLGKYRVNLDWSRIMAFNIYIMNNGSPKVFSIHNVDCIARLSEKLEDNLNYATDWHPQYFPKLHKVKSGSKFSGGEG